MKHVRVSLDLQLRPVHLLRNSGRVHPRLVPICSGAPKLPCLPDTYQYADPRRLKLLCPYCQQSLDLLLTSADHRKEFFDLA